MVETFRSARFFSQINFRTLRVSTQGPIRCRNVLGGIIRDYYRDAA
jgi:hypothetical protein